jgi:crossover junction endodeoxyribonuclease RuvC
MLIIGIDPGATGALVMLDGGEPIEWMAMPTYKFGSSTRVNSSEVRNFIRQRNYIDHVYVEQVAARPGQGVTSMFNFGHSCGTIMGVIGALNCPHTLVTPQAWKKSAGLIGTDKDAARARAIQLWPHWSDLSAKIKGQALADAALIAVFGSKK